MELSKFILSLFRLLILSLLIRRIALRFNTLLYSNRLIKKTQVLFAVQSRFFYHKCDIMSVMNKHFEPSFNVIRAVSAVAIVLFHYSYTFYEYGIKMHGPEFLMFKNGDYGGIFVAVFFMLSGAAILHNHPHLSDNDDPGFSGTLKNILRFYGKRWLSLFPMFYIAWTVMYIINSNRVGSWFWGGPRKNFILSFLGMDGYFLHLGMNYYNLGEWFLGGIIFMYLLYPFLLFLWNRARIPGTLLIVFFFLFNLRRHYFSSAPDTNIFIVLIKYYNSHITISDNMCIWTCVLDFWLGFILLTYALPTIKKMDLRMRVISVILIISILLVFINVDLPLFKLETCTIMAVLTYILLSVITPFITARPSFNALLNMISKYSYGIFLVHHVILYGIMYLVKGFTFSQISSIIFFIPLYALIFFAGLLLTKVSGYIVNIIKSMLSRAS